MIFFISVHVFICVFLVVVILLQPGKSDAGVGFGSSSQSIFGSKGAGNFLTKTTTVCAVLFLVTSLYLTRSRIQSVEKSVIPVGGGAAKTAPPTPVPAGTGQPTPAPTAGAKSTPEPAKK